ncbi:MAG: endonuclease/exonuclease/phosphatase family protein [Chitinophagales bacterium]
MAKVRNLGLIILGIVSACFLLGEAKAQNLPIFLDGRFDDWFNITTQYEDNVGDTNSAFGIDLLNFSVTNNKDYLFIQLDLNQDIKLVEDNELFLYLDTDENPQTGKNINGIGAEVGIDFGNRLVYMYPNNSLFTYDLDRIGYRSLPTTSGYTHEIALSRNTLMPDNNTLVFLNSSIKVLFKDENTTNGDSMPDNGSVFTYTFEDNPVEVDAHINIEREESHHLRLMTYNVLHNGLTDGSRVSRFRRIIQATVPDIITFNECWDVTAGQAKGFMDNILPLSTDFGWHTEKLDDGNITASRYPILQSWQVSPGRRITASLIELPRSIFSKDILVINAHFKCCGNGDSQRQGEADAFAAFIQDAKTTGGRIDLPENTPFILAGDLNLVGASQQLTTILEGDIVSNFIYGEDAPLDWDNTDLEDVISPQTGDYMAFTWLGEGSNFPAGRLDFMIHSNSVLDVKKAYTINTNSMSPQDLDYYGLNASDTDIASDHLPKVTDFEMPVTTDIASINTALQLQVQPNPFNKMVKITYQTEELEELQWEVFNATGQIVWQSNTKTANGNFDLSNTLTESGVYLLKVSNTKTQTFKTLRLLKL